MREWIREQLILEWPNLWAAKSWIPAALILGGSVFLLVVWSYRNLEAPRWLKNTCGLAKALSVVLLASMLVEPMRSETKPVPGANLFVVMADRSQSLQLGDPDETTSRAERLKIQLQREQAWQVRLSQEFDVRRYEFDRQLQPVADFEQFAPDGEATAIVSSLRAVTERYAGRPTAGILLFTDGNATDLSEEAIDWSALPPIYPVILGDEETENDISLTRVSATQTNFEASPVTVSAEILGRGFEGDSVVVELLDEAGEKLQSQTITDIRDDRAFSVRFQLKPQFQVDPEKRGILFYRVRAYAKSEEGLFENPAQTSEATLINNSRLVKVDRGGGIHKVLYVSGRPNWEFKYLNRAIAEDDELQLHGLIRIAKKEPKFQYRKKDTNANRLFTNTDDQQKEQVEQYDEPVLLRIGKFEEGELAGGFPKSADDLFGYDALILDDLEAEFFTQDQKSLIQDFVSQRGGGFLMLGGLESFAEGNYHRTPIGDLLPVYLAQLKDAPSEPAYTLALTREGRLEPWVRVRSTESEEQKRLDEMPLLRTLNPVGALKPGASELSFVRTNTGETRPALVTQRFGKGRTAAMLIGDMWRWRLHQESPENDDLEKTWRQTVRWLVGDVPRRVEVETTRPQNDPNHPVEIAVNIRDEKYKPLDNATVTVNIETPDGNKLTLTAEPRDAVSGQYAAAYVPRTPGAYHASVVAHDSDGSEIAARQTGWVSEPASEEFRTLKPNRAFLEQLAHETQGEVVRLERLESFANSFTDRKVPFSEPQIHAVWHKWGVFLLAVGLLVLEWGLRRWKGLA